MLYLGAHVTRSIGAVNHNRMGAISWQASNNLELKRPPCLQIGRTTRRNRWYTIIGRATVVLRRTSLEVKEPDRFKSLTLLADVAVVQTPLRRCTLLVPRTGPKEAEMKVKKELCKWRREELEINSNELEQR
ncbi:hypothetical protein MUK42_32408 [Musa troglodytarum]|uniref:Uncharacterized protein n=1 Tax=Musa troglodytarum TaxID=320322 RepID=A0A9E7EY05_9LILI|nr:hypothetical protein MUK42_32408 [Musa troglodytarum]